jgi:CspA family cold shock protein
MSRRTGTIKWYNADKGFGFIAQTEGEDLWFSFRQLASDDGYQELHEGQPVSFNVVRGQKGLIAQAVQVGPLIPAPPVPPLPGALWMMLGVALGVALSAVFLWRALA